MVKDTETGAIEPDELKAKIASDGMYVDSGVVSSMLESEMMQKGELQTVGLSPVDFHGIYGTGAHSLTQSALLPVLPEPSDIPAMSKAYAAVSAPDQKTDAERTFEIADIGYEPPTRLG